MVEVASGVCVHLLDPIPGVVIARVTDALRDLGHRVELRGQSFSAGAARIPVETILEHGDASVGMTDLYLTSRPLDSRAGGSIRGAASSDGTSAIVGVPKAPRRDRFKPEFANRVLGRVLRQLGRLHPQA